MPSNYNSVAWFYDGLSRLVFGNTLKNAQVFFLPRIKKGSTILIAGGGTGWILEELALLHPSGLFIDYVESSGSMMSRAKKRNAGQNTVRYIQTGIQLHESKVLYDTILTGFLFDNFKMDTIEKIFLVLRPALKPEGRWIYTDFTDGSKLSQRIVLKVMFAFFRVFCQIESDSLEDMLLVFNRHSLALLDEVTFTGGFVVSREYSGR